MKRTNVSLFFLVLFANAAATLHAYNICNKSNLPIFVIVVESEAKAKECLTDMGWQGECWNYVTGQTIKCKNFPQKSNLWLIPQPKLDVFRRPKQYIEVHKIAEQGVCDRYNARDIQRNFERKDYDKLYFMVFEKFKKKSSSKIHFLTSGYFNVQSTISFSGSPDAGWELHAQ